MIDDYCLWELLTLAVSVHALLLFCAIVRFSVLRGQMYYSLRKKGENTIFCPRL